MSTSTATVEVLTAEVRVLMVGARQVTLSVAKQLDVVPLWELGIYGRVKISDRGRGRVRPLVIGLHHSTGALALAEYSDCPINQDPRDRAATDAPLIVLAGLK